MARFSLKGVKRITVATGFGLCIAACSVGEEMLESLKLLTGRGAMLVCNLAAT